MKNYRFGFSLKGFISFVLIMIPNILWINFPPTNDILLGNNADNPIFYIVLNISQWFMIALLVILINKTNEKRERKFIAAAGLCLAGYYILWVCYFIGIINPWFLIGMALLPSMYFIFVELWMRNYIAIIPSIVFGIIHIAITYSNYI